MALLNKLSGHLNRFPVFVVVGGIAFASNFVLTYILTDIVHLWYLISVVIGTVFSWTVQFFLNSRLTFVGHPKDEYGKRYLKNIGIYIALAPIGFGAIYLLTSIAGIHYLVSLTSVVGVMSIASFFITKKHVFEYNE